MVPNLTTFTINNSILNLTGVFNRVLDGNVPSALHQLAIGTIGIYGTEWVASRLDFKKKLNAEVQEGVDIFVGFGLRYAVAEVASRLLGVKFSTQYLLFDAVATRLSLGGVALLQIPIAIISKLVGGAAFQDTLFFCGMHSIVTLALKGKTTRLENKVSDCFESVEAKLVSRVVMGVLVYGIGTYGAVRGCRYFQLNAGWRLVVPSSFQVLPIIFISSLLRAFRYAYSNGQRDNYKELADLFRACKVDQLTQLVLKETNMTLEKAKNFLVNSIINSTEMFDENKEKAIANIKECFKAYDQAISRLHQTIEHVD